jgi:hypothetical protein
MSAITMDKIRILWRHDDSADLSFLGEYVDDREPGCIDRQAEGDWERGQFRYFKPSDNHFPHRPEGWAHVSQPEIDVAFAKLPKEWQVKLPEYGTKIATLDAFYVWQDYQRMEAHNNDEWYMRGCAAEAEVSYETGWGHRRIERFMSSGLWGIESDSDPDYERQVEDEQLEELREHLAVFGVDVSEFGERIQEMRSL